jgi:DDE superfamily endonuclease
MAQDVEVVARFFDLYFKTVEEYDIQDGDIYNMDEKGVMAGQIGEEKVIVTADTRFAQKSFVTQDGSREWVTIISCISLDGRYLPLYVIFKGVKRKLEWLDHLPEGGAIAMSPNGWTDVELGVDWFKRIFKP